MPILRFLGAVDSDQLTISLVHCCLQIEFPRKKSVMQLVGPAGEVEISCGVIAAKRHIHMTPADAVEFGVTDKQIVKVEIETEGRSLIFGDVVCRVSENYATAMHIDTDESNAAGCGREVYGTIIK